VEFPVYVGDDEVEEAEEDEEEEYEEDEEEEYEEEDEYDDEEADEYEDIPPMALPRDAAPPILVQSEWELPNANVLLRTKEQRQDRLATEAAGEDLVAALAAHGVETTLLGYTIGPTVTRFELELGPGVKVARVTSLNKDIAYAMASPDVRILAPIPGRSAIGVEVPNRQRSLVALGDLLASEEAQSAVHPLDVPIGRDIAGRTVVVNLGAMPHILISGATGAGKSSCINSLITSLVMRATPDQLRLILVDPKRVELGQYNDLPHLLAPVVVDPKKAANTLNWAVREMERRYDILAANGVRDITSYQEAAARGELEAPMSTRAAVADVMERTTGLATELDEPTGPENLPYIVIVVDELNDLMMVAARDVEDSVVRIAQMARAVGIHLVLATQRPSVDVITGVIKANIPSRMAFAVSSLGDSRVILDQAGAERLIGKGDMLLLTASSNIARRLQSPWVSEDEVRKVVASWRAQGGRAETVVALDVPTGLSGSSASSGSDDDDDALLRQARELVIRSQSGSTSMLQRKMRIGFARAGRLMDMLEEEEVVAPGDGSKARKVLVTLEEYEQQQSSY
jgi:S-DNA-T family DNA segregation ATPase FtsK/SpoIIIE